MYLTIATVQSPDCAQAEKSIGADAAKDAGVRRDQRL